ncbi:Crp/Fnr family transcriptional regulator [Ideonella sp. A 288]|uniref:Crp/Fnr family transcriptional regulator n=1 Tax=Ideonella sp. A 288 TaxID=1962181 RepID=UPI000B4BDBCF|nr:Crp/Fnr family transcriptional regulator [Ideonella sp. A 288]
MRAQSSPTDNLLINALPQEVVARWCQRLERITMPLGMVMYESGIAMTHVVFPTTAVVALLYVTERGSSTEIGIVGREGVVGVPLFMGGGSTPSSAVVQIAGEGWRLPGPFIKEEFDHPGPVQHLLLRYTQALITQMAQTAVCNRHHTIDQQLCRWLLLSLDSLSGNELVMTHELIANLLGVRREGVTESALKLQRDGLIRYARGHIQVLDRPGLEHRACECYRVVRNEHDRLMPERHLPELQLPVRQWPERQWPVRLVA